ncbi:GNAT superfamily N-acetyltransferase [Spinactinospora alkalitolerans]|uniref:GNAT superfamily N-acetyltransferase n=1 Tax=Spinactinospora alkalitolerans TaxID=687207 RepID=A0A852U081_9ACTN|nr:GNAT family N-acetyltransferase [Spinactinospora alkalitolerans]NYE49598.1 GNAT superfamily N-acetyltransferase [Spinactinospora alkalitolerans]
MTPTWRIDEAGEGDLPEVVTLLNEVAQRLRNRGIEQWALGWMTDARIRPAIMRGEVFVVRAAKGRIVATVLLTDVADADFWTPEEQQTKALYVAKLARSDDHPGVGSWLLRWGVDYAARKGYSAVRLDAWATNEGLHQYYRDRGWTHLRTMRVPGRRSGALFEHEASPDPAVHEVFEEGISTR